MRRLLTTARSTKVKPTWSQCSETVWVHGLDASALSETVERAKAAQVFQGRCSFVPPSALNYELPTSGVPELAFAGKSNVGKSTLIGTLLGDSSLLRRSKRPGCTRSVNFFAVPRRGRSTSVPRKSRHRNSGALAAKAAAEARAFVVDLPGFGFAKRSREEQAGFSRATLDYLSARPREILRQALVLVDARRGPDEDVLNAFSALKVAHRVILTKADLATPVEIATSLQATLDHLRGARASCLMPVVHVISAKTGLGIDDLRAHLAALAIDKFTD